jgi:hypothetical protein
MIISNPWAMAILGGAMMGLSISILLFFNGRIAGVGGITGNLLQPVRGDVAGNVSCRNYYWGHFLGCSRAPFIQSGWSLSLGNCRSGIRRCHGIWWAHGKWLYQWPWYVRDLPDVKTTPGCHRRFL